MNEIICPHCSKAFKVDETGYSNILKQVRDSEFDKDVKDRLDQYEKEKSSALALAAKDSDSKIQALKSEKELEIEQLKSKLRESEQSTKLTVTEAIKAIEKDRDNLKNDLKNAQLEKQNSENLLKDKYKTQIRDRDEQIDRLKDMKAKLSTKMVGETLEQHCEIEFNKIRATAFRNAFFEKDNDASSGSKGDYIFRDFDDYENEIVSIMFEMKNESDTTSTKRKMKIFAGTG